MTLPRPVVPGRVYMVTRRCTQRMFLLRPDRATNESFKYCVAVAAQKYGVEMISLQVMSNHYHAVIRDVHGNYPEFLRFLNSLLARCINAVRGRWENLWATEQASVLLLADAEAILSETIYTLTNAVKDHLVDAVRNWPGVCSYRYQLVNKPMVVKRPRHFFDPTGAMPEHIELHFVRPAEFRHLSHEEWAGLLREQVATVERAAANRRRTSNIKLLGRKAVRRQSPYSSPRTIAKRRAMVPRVATKNTSLRIERLEQNKLFAHHYRLAREALRAGVERLFPCGTYQLRVRQHVSCEAAQRP
jgi:putative transposase